MRKIRFNTFETNSSSTHTLCICSKEKYDKWNNGELYYWDNNNNFYTAEELKVLIKEMIFKNKINTDYKNKTIEYKGVIKNYENHKDKNKKIREFMSKEEIELITDEEVKEYYEKNIDRYDLPITIEKYFDDENLETYKKDYTTENGDKIVVFGKYGSDW